MKFRRLTTAVAAIAAFAFVLPQVASAQAPPPPPGPGGGGGPGGPPPPPGQGQGGPGWGKPVGLTWGFDFSIGGMKSKNTGSIQCADCNYDTAAGGFGAHLGFQLNPQLSIAADLRGTGQLISSDFFSDAYLIQTTFMGVAKYHLAPRFWITGGLGFANLSITVDDGYVQSDEKVDNGGAVMIGGGIEVATGRKMSIDLSLRIIDAAYDGLGDHIQSVMLGLDFNFHPRPVVHVMTY